MALDKCRWTMFVSVKMETVLSKTRRHVRFRKDLHRKDYIHSHMPIYAGACLFFGGEPDLWACMLEFFFFENMWITPMCVDDLLETSRHRIRTYMTAEGARSEIAKAKCVT